MQAARSRTPDQGLARLQHQIGTPAAASIPSVDGAGVIEALGAVVTGYAAGDAVDRLVGAWADRGRFQVNVDRAFALSKVMSAWQYSQAGHTRGKAVIEIGR